MGGKQRTTNGISDYYDNIDYIEEMNVQNLMYEDSMVQNIKNDI